MPRIYNPVAYRRAVIRNRLAGRKVYKSKYVPRMSMRSGFGQAFGKGAYNYRPRTRTLQGRGGFWGDLWKSGRKYIPRLIGGAAGVATGLGWNAGYGTGAKVSQDILGWGAYKVSKNTLAGYATVDQVPSVHGTSEGIRIRNKEFLGDILGTVAFTNTSFALNPGLENVAPWLSNIAAQFEQYRYEGLVFYFKTTSVDALNSTNTALGTVLMATNYNAASPAYTSKQEMMEQMWSTSAKPSVDSCHPIECASQLTTIKNLYTRTGAVPSGQDQHFFDLGTFQIATVGSQSGISTIGELWVAYDVVLMKPRAYSSYGYELETAHYADAKSADVVAGAPLGQTQNALTQSAGMCKLYDSIGLTLTSTTVTFPVGCQGIYMILITWKGTETGSIASFGVNAWTNCAVARLCKGSSANSQNLPLGASADSSEAGVLQYITIPDPTKVAAIGFSTGSTFPTTLTITDLVITQVSGNLV